MKSATESLKSAPKRYIAWHYYLDERGAQARLAGGRKFYDAKTHRQLLDVAAILESLKRNSEVISQPD